MKSYFDFEGGPLDGATLALSGDDIWLGEIRVCLPVKGDNDPEGVCTAQAVHSYVCCHSSEFEGSGQVTHFMIHLSVTREQLGTTP